jgi:ribosomal protein L31E
MTVVTIKLARVKKPEVLNELIRTLKFNEQPLSKRMTTKAIVVITSPIFPKSEGETIWKTGPITIPNIIRINTSGIKVFLKTKLKA